jgi:hypothetical protein
MADRPGAPMPTRAGGAPTGWCRATLARSSRSVCLHGDLWGEPLDEGGASYHRRMARCTAPVRGHRTASGAAACPVHGGRYGSYGSYTRQPSYSSVYQSRGGGGGSVGGSTRPRAPGAHSPHSLSYDPPVPGPPAEATSRVPSLRRTTARPAHRWRSRVVRCRVRHLRCPPMLGLLAGR